MRIVRVVACLLLAVCLHATTYVVPSDRAMIASSDAVVSGTVVDSYCRRAADGTIETVTRVRVGERFKGPDSATFDVVQWGGHLGDEWMSQSDAPALARGESVLLFLTRNSNGDWTPYSIALGVFHVGDGVLERASIAGWSQDGTVYEERARLELPFLAFIRATCNGEESRVDYFAASESAMRQVQSNATFTSAGYGGFLGGVPARRQDNALDVVWRVSGAQSGLDLNAAADFGIAQWSGQSPKIHYSRGGAATGDTRGFDSEHRIIANDPHSDIAGTFPGSTGVVGTAFSFGGSNFAFNGDTFKSVTHSDIVINDGVSGANVSVAIFNIAVTHELGHTLGLRHSNQDQALTSACAAPLDCCINTVAGGSCKAVMLSNIVTIGGLQQWDRNAIDCLYDAVCASDGACTPASIATPPPNRTIAPGATTSLSVVAGGTGPFNYQWYIGSAGDVAIPTGSNSATLASLSPAVTTSYWVRVTGVCGAPADSAAATVTVTAVCANVIIQSATAKVAAGGETTLSANAVGGTGMTYTWFIGETPGSGGTQLGTGTPFVIPITQPTTFWVRARNSCGNSSVSAPIVAVPLSECVAPAIAVQPQASEVRAGQSVLLSVAATGTASLSYEWFEGVVGDVSKPAGTNAPSFQSSPLFADTHFWVRVTNGCGSANSTAASVHVLVPRRHAVRS